CQTFGLHRIFWPRGQILEEGGRRLCRDLVMRWMSKDGKPVRASVQQWVQEQWGRNEFAAERLIAELQDGSDQALGHSVESALAALIEPVVQWQNVHAGKEPEPAVVLDVLKQMDQWLGKPPQPQAKDKSRKNGACKQEGLRTANLVRGSEAAGVVEEALRAKGEELCV